MAVSVALVFAHWGLTTKDALDRGIFNFDSLWYHMPFAVEMAQSHSVTGMHHTETVFTNWFYPQNSELLHAVGMLLTGRDTLSLFLNFGWLAVAFLAAWCIGRPYGRGPAQRRRGGDPARVPHAGRARARRGQERPHGRRSAARRDRDPGQRLAQQPGRRAGGAGPLERRPLVAGRLAAGAAGLAVGLAAGTKVDGCWRWRRR